jgi:hypothetical protein
MLDATRLPVPRRPNPRARTPAPEHARGQIHDTDRRRVYGQPPLLGVSLDEEQQRGHRPNEGQSRQPDPEPADDAERNADSWRPAQRPRGGAPPSKFDPEPAGDPVADPVYDPTQVIVNVPAQGFTHESRHKPGHEPADQPAAEPPHSADHKPGLERARDVVPEPALGLPQRPSKPATAEISSPISSRRRR